jgi:hypothetical protein
MSMEAMEKNDNLNIFGLVVNKEGVKGAAIGPGSGIIIDKSMETLTKKTNEEGQEISGWWKKEYTYVTAGILSFLVELIGEKTLVKNQVRKYKKKKQ